MAATGAVAFLKICLAKVPGDIARSRIRFRMNSGFYGQRIIRFIDESGCGYVIAVKKNSVIQTKAQQCRFQEFPSRHRPLVKTIVSAQRILDRHPRYDSYRLPASPSQVDQTWQSEHFAVAKGFPSTQRISAGFAQNSEAASTQKFPFLQVTFQLASSRQLSKIAFACIFED